jgi:hypothetical protein
MKSSQRVRLVGRLGCVLLSGALFVPSFLLPALEDVHDSPIVVTGWQANLAPLELFADLWSHPGAWTREQLLVLVVWLSNPLFLTGLTLLATGFPGRAGLVALLALALALVWPLHVFPDLKGYLVGYYLWAGSMALLALVSFGYGAWIRALAWRRSTAPASCA